MWGVVRVALIVVVVATASRRAQVLPGATNYTESWSMLWPTIDDVALLADLEDNDEEDWIENFWLRMYQLYEQERATNARAAGSMRCHGGRRHCFGLAVISSDTLVGIVSVWHEAAGWKLFMFAAAASRRCLRLANMTDIGLEYYVKLSGVPDKDNPWGVGLRSGMVHLARRYMQQLSQDVADMIQQFSALASSDYQVLFENMDIPCMMAHAEKVNSAKMKLLAIVVEGWPTIPAEELQSSIARLDIVRVRLAVAVAARLREIGFVQPVAQSVLRALGRVYV